MHEPYKPIKFHPSKIATDLLEIQQCQIPRYLGLSGGVTYRLLCFCDASAKAFATVVYLQLISANTSICRLIPVFSKTRLVPTKQVSMPRLELLAVIIGVRSLHLVESQLKLKISEKNIMNRLTMCFTLDED